MVPAFLGFLTPLVLLAIPLLLVAGLGYLVYKLVS